MPVRDIPLVGSPTQRGAIFLSSSNTAQQDQSFLNAVFRVVQNPVTGAGIIQVRPASAIATYIDFATASGVGRAVIASLGITGSQDAVFGAFGATNDTILKYDGSTTNLGAITGHVAFFSETTISNVVNIVAVADSNRAWCYPNGGALTEITDVDFPPKQATPLTLAGNFVHKDGFAFIMCTNGQIWNSDLNSLVDWTSTSFISADASPDTGVGLAIVGDKIAGFGRTSVQFFVNTGNATGSPLSPIKSMTLNIGAVNAKSILPVGANGVAFVGASQTTTSGVYLLSSSGGLAKISSPAVDQWISEEQIQNVRLFPWIDAGKFILGMTGASSTMAWAYDVDLKIWSYLESDGLVGSSIIPSVQGGSGSRVVYVSSAYNSIIKWTNQDAVRTMTIAVGPIKPKGRFGFMHRLTLLSDGIALTGTSFYADVSWKEQSEPITAYSTARRLYLQAVSPFISRLGKFVSRILKIVVTAPSGSGSHVAIEGLWLDTLRIHYEESSS